MKRKSIQVLIVFLNFLLVLPHFTQAQNVPKKVDLPTGYKEELNVVYKTAGTWKGLMDIYFPTGTKGNIPLLVNIHGGGWNTGSKEMDNWFGSYFKKGYAVANINYRLAGTASAPAAIEDVRCALNYLLDRAKELQFDTDKIVLCGTSAGGHLALLAGMLGSDGKFDKDCKFAKPIKIAAIIDKWGVSDVQEWGFGAKSPGNAAVKRWLGENIGDAELVKALSAINYLTKDSPPVFIVHGDADVIVPVSHSIILHQKLKALGVKTSLFIIPDGRHGNFGSVYSKEINDRFVSFLNDLNL